MATTSKPVRMVLGLISLEVYPVNGFDSFVVYSERDRVIRRLSEELRPLPVTLDGAYCGKVFVVDVITTKDCRGLITNFTLHQVER